MEKDEKQRRNEADYRALIAEVAELLRERGFIHAGWIRLDEVQRTDAVETFIREVGRYAASNFEGRPIDRDEYDEDYATRDDTS